MNELRLYLFGTPRIEFQGQLVKIGRRKALAIAAYLALAEHPQSRDTVAALLWPELDAEHAHSALRSTLSALTTPIPIEWIQADRTLLEVNREALWIDVNVFLELLAQTVTHGHQSEVICAQCVELYKRAIELYRVDFLEGFTLSASLDYDDWQRMQQIWLRREFIEIHGRLSEYYAQTLQYDQAIKYAQQWIVVDPLHEPAYRQLMRLYAANGQHSDALRQYRQCVELFDTELATPPDAETRLLYEAIQSNQLPASPVLQSDASARPLGIIPPLPSHVIGREAALREIKCRVGIGCSEKRGITLIQGWPGVGKSTTVAMLAHDAEIAQQFPDGVLWTSLGETPSILREISAWADALRLPEAGRGRTPEEISAQLTVTLRDKRVFLIVDDVWDVEHALPFRVGGQYCAMVMTSRLNDVAMALAPTAGDIYRLPVLSESSSLELLGELTPETLSEHPTEARELVHDLEGLPLALHVAGRLLHSEAHLGWGVHELLNELRAGAKLLQAQPPSDMISPRHDTSPTIAALLKRSTDLLDAEARYLFACLGLFVPKPATFDLDAMRVAWDVSDARPVARRLVNRGLLEPIGGGRFQMHALLVFHARSLLVEAGYV